MSAPTPAPGDDRPREGYYPDPSIPGYVRYWNGAAWVPGTSRPAPNDGRPLSPPPGAGPAQPSVEETGPHFFDEDPVEEPRRVSPAEEPRQVSPAEAQHGSRPEPASAWGADRSQQSGFGGDQDRRVSWGAPQGADPRAPLAGRPDGTTRTDGTATIPPADSAGGTGSGSGPSPASDGTTVFRRPTRDGGAATAAPGTSGTGGPAADEGTMKFRALSPRTGEQGGSTEAAGSGSGQPAAARPTNAQAAARQALGLDPEAPDPAPQRTAPPQQQASAPATGVPPQQSAGSLSQQPAAGVPQQSAAPAATPMTTGAGGGQPSWAQQVHRLASSGPDGGPVAPWKPPVEDVFQAAARAQAAARPAGLGKRLAARLLDTLVLAAITGVAAVPLGTKAIDHINGKIDAAKQSGQTVTVWLLDGTTSVYLAIVLAVLLGFGVLYEVLPTAKWGRTLGKKLCGIEVRDIEGHEPPAFGPALRRWLVYSVPGLLVVGVVGVLWCVFDRPWRQCWHDKAAHTFVAG
ncbi:RDD family protein [Streptomyces yaanensis]|uniref:RDD family protein n=1 Tax=Streptomyces yaanensis TaxID=1142239 RepID=A0ABV7SND8_9ACTN|nr:RDD family protein [Streptomyces sp. CGMCC 4.7035]WNC02131.1 RDD family protein [Streptomyces sp. CGMCC 4.7035]